MFDLTKTTSLIVGGLLNHKRTWETYLSENHSWKETAILLTGPLILVSVLLAAILRWVFSSFYVLPLQGGFLSIILGLIGAVIGIAVASFIFSFLAGKFKGKDDFNKGFAALSLAAIPGYIGSILGTLPMIGWLASLALGIFSLVLLYMIIPSYLEVPQEKRVVHFIASLIATFFLALIINLILGVGVYKTGAFDPSVQKTNSFSSSSGFLGGVERQSNIIESAENDRFSPPTDGKITESQITTFILNLNKAADYRKSQEDKVKNLDAEMKGKKDFSFSDIGKLTSGFNSLMSTANAEMEVVKTGGGNWAEHQWVRNQLKTALIQKDINEAVKSNYALYQKYQDQLDDL